MILLLHLTTGASPSSPIHSEHASTVQQPCCVSPQPLSLSRTRRPTVAWGDPRRSQGGGAHDADLQNQSMSCEKQWVMANDKRWANQLGALRPRSPQLMITLQPFSHAPMGAARARRPCWPHRKGGSAWRVKAMSRCLQLSLTVDARPPAQPRPHRARQRQFHNHAPCLHSRSPSLARVDKRWLGQARGARRGAGPKMRIGKISQ